MLHFRTNFSDPTAIASLFHAPSLYGGSTCTQYGSTVYIVIAIGGPAIYVFHFQHL